MLHYGLFKNFKHYPEPEFHMLTDSKKYICSMRDAGVQQGGGGDDSMDEF